MMTLMRHVLLRKSLRMLACLIGSCTDVPLPISENAYWLTGDVNKIIQTPVETAIHRYDPVIFLLVGLGASLNVGTKESYEGSWTGKASLLEAVETTIKGIGKELQRLQRPDEPETMDVDRADQSEWKAWITKSNQAIRDFTNKENKREQDNERIKVLTSMKDYLEEVLGLLNEKKAKRWSQIHPDIKRKEESDDDGDNDDGDDGDKDKDKQQKPVEPFFSVWTSNWWDVPVLQEKVPLYEELYEACWNGDDDKIRELCLPPPGGTTRKVAPIQIVCKTAVGGELLSSSMIVSFITHATVCRVHPAACCDPSSSLVNGEDYPDNCHCSAADKARGYHHGGL